MAAQALESAPGPLPEGEGPGFRHALYHACLLAASGAALVGSGYGLARLFRNRVGLQEVFGSRILLLIPLLGLGVLVAAVALAGRARAWRARARRGRAGRPTLRPFRALFCALVLGWLGYVTVLQPFRRLIFDLALAVTLSAFAAWLLFRAEAVPSKRARVAGFLVFQACLAVVLVEGGLRVVSVIRPAPLLVRADAAASARLRAARIAPGRMHFGFPHNERGYYDEPFGPRRPGVRRVVALSDSFGFGAVPHRYHYTTVAEGRLDAVEVLNVGVPGVGPPEYLHLVRTETLGLEPDLIVICLFLGNDVGFLGPGAAAVTPELASWLDRDKLMLTTVLERLARLAAEREGLADEGGPIAGVWAPPAAGDEAPRLDTEEELFAACPWLVDPLLERPGMTQDAFLRLEIVRGSDVCVRVRDFYEPLFRTLDAIAAAVGDVPLAVLLIPDELQVEDAVWDEVAPALEAEGLSPVRDRAQQRVGEDLAARGIPFVDLLPALRAEPPLEDGRRHVYHLRDTHFNRRGNRVAGEGLAELIEAALGR